MRENEKPRRFPPRDFRQQKEMGRLGTLTEGLVPVASPARASQLLTTESVLLHFISAEVVGF